MLEQKRLSPMVQKNIETCQRGKAEKKVRKTNKYNYFTRFKRVNVKFDKLRLSPDSVSREKLISFSYPTLTSISHPSLSTPSLPRSTLKTTHSHYAMWSLAPIASSPSRGNLLNVCTFEHDLSSANKNTLEPKMMRARHHNTDREAGDLQGKFQ